MSAVATADHLKRPQSEWNWPSVGIVWFWLVVLGAAWIAGPRLVPDGDLHTPVWIVLLGVLLFTGYQVLQKLVQMRSGPQVSATIVVGTLMLLAILLGMFTIEQLEEDTAEARAISALIFNQRVLDGTATIVDDDARIRGLVMNEEVIVEVRVNGETIEAPLAPDALTELDIDKIAALETALVNNQKVKVILPDGTVAEGELTGIPMGEQLPLTLGVEDPQTVRETSIYSALTVGENVIRANGRTEPLSQARSTGAGGHHRDRRDIPRSWVRGGSTMTTTGYFPVAAYRARGRWASPWP